MNLFDVLQFKYPNADFINEIQVSDYADGNGPQISVWNYKEAVRPTSDEINQWLTDPVLTAQVTISQSITLLDEYINNQARAKQYDSALSLLSYLDSSNTTWATQALIFKRWRDAVWSYAIDAEQRILAGTLTFTSFEDFLSHLPTLDWGS